MANYDPIAETFTVYQDGSAGIFLTKMDLFFAGKHPTLGVFVELREVDSAGYVTSNSIPYSKVRISSANINISDDSSAATTCTFLSPIFLLNNTTYAFVVTPEGNNDSTVMWTSRLGETDVLTDKVITSQSFDGVLSVSSNGTTFTAIQIEDLKFVLYKAKFTVGSGTANFVNYPTEFLNVANTSGNFTAIGEEIHGETRLILSSIAGGTISVTDKIVGNSSNSHGFVTYANTSSIRVKGVPETKFETTEAVSVYYANGSSKGVTGTITSITVPASYLMSYDVVDSNTIQMVLKRRNTTPVYITGEELRGQSSNNYCKISSFFNRKYNLLNPQSSTIELMGTSIDWETKTTSNTGTLDTTSTQIEMSQNFTFPNEKVLKSFSVTPGTLKMAATMVTADENISPIIDVDRTHGIYVHNIINDDSTGEDQDSGGNAFARYISKIVTLDEGQDAEDLMVYVTGYKPPNTDILVYYKILNSGDSDNFGSIPWIKMDTTSTSSYSDAENSEDFKEMVYSIPSSYLTGVNGAVQYENSEGITFTSYKYLTLKMVLLGTDSANVPRMRDYRALCLQK